MKRITSIVAGSCFAVLIACGGCAPKLKAQTEPGAIFSVPFSFTTDGHRVAAGTYEVRRLSSPFMISISNVETGKKEIFTARPEHQQNLLSKGLLVFHRCGQRTELTEFHIPGTELYSVLIAPQLRQNAEFESCSSPDTMTIAAR
jgi:hypothetical protein